MIMHKTIFSFIIWALAVLTIVSAANAQTVIATYQIHDHASGLAFDGRNIWYGRYGTQGERIYKFDTVLEQIVDSLDLGAANLDDAYGMTWDGSHLWVTNHVGSDFTLKIDTLGNILYQFQNPSNYMSGLAWNGTHLYMGDYYEPDGAIYRVDTTGTILENFPAPNAQPWDLAWDGQYLWVADYYAHHIYQVDPDTHNTVFSFPSPMNNPAGLAWDGQYLWVCDEGQGYSIDHLYKIDPFGGGTPEITVSPTSLEYGFVPLGANPHLAVTVGNVGSANLIVSELPISQFGGDFYVDTALTVPFTLSTGQSQNVNVYYRPLNFGSSSGTLHIRSNDPINGDVPVTLTGYGIYPQRHIWVSDSSVNFGSVWVPQGAHDGLTGREYEIRNLGAEPLNLISLNINDPAFNQSGFQSGQLASMDTLKFTVYFHPTQAITYSGTMTLTTNDPAHPVIDISLSGVGTVAAFSRGDIIWQMQAEPSTFNSFNSIKFTDDINRDGVPEVIAANENYIVYTINGQSAGTGDVFGMFDTGVNPLRTGSVYKEQGMVSAPDLNNDGVDDYVIGTTGGSRSVFAVSGRTSEQIWCFDTHNFGGGEGGWVYEVTCEDDWNNDGVWDVLAAVGGSSDPRSVFLLSGTDGSVIWRAHLGETVYAVRRLDDVDNDGYDEVVCSTSPSTGTYTIKRLDGQTGTVDWMRSVSGVVFSLNRIDDLNGDNVADIAAAASTDGVYALSGANGTDIWHLPSMGLNYWLEVTEDLNNSGYADMLVTSVSGTFYAFEGLNGTAIWSVNFGSNVLSLSATPDITGDNIPDACCGIMNGSFQAVSGADGAVLFSYIHGGGSSYAFDAVGWLPDIDNSGAAELLGGTRDGHLYCFSGGDVARILDLTLTPLNPPVIIPAGGGQFQFNAAVFNPGNQAVQFDAWIMATLPDGRPYGPVLLRTGNNIPGGAAINRILTQNVPGIAPLGNYGYTGYVGLYTTNEVWDEDSFSFTKLGADHSAPGDWNIAGWEQSLGQTDSPVTSLNFELHRPSPNPFNATTALSYKLQAASNVKLTVYDITGREVYVVVEGFKLAGIHQAVWDGSSIASGVYFCKLEANGFTGIQKMLLLK